MPETAKVYPSNGSEHVDGAASGAQTHLRRDSSFGAAIIHIAVTNVLLYHGVLKMFVTDSTSGTSAAALVLLFEVFENCEDSIHILADIVCP